MTEVVRTHLELTDRASLRAKAKPDGDVRIELRQPISAQEYRPLYAAVGGPWFWRDRLKWSDDELDAYLEQPEIQVWTLSVGDEFAGYFELRRYPEGRVDIAYFGLVERFIGRGLGGWMLTRAVEEAFAFGAERVTLDTCTLDSVHALPNYLKRGFTKTREEHYDYDTSA